MKVLTKAIRSILLAAFITSPAMAADCGNWAASNWAGKFDNGYFNLLTIQKVRMEYGTCVVDLVYTVKPRLTFHGRNDFITRTPLTKDGKIKFKTLGTDGGRMTYKLIGPKKIKGMYHSSTKTSYITLVSTTEKYKSYN